MVKSQWLPKGRPLRQKDRELVRRCTDAELGEWLLSGQRPLIHHGLVRGGRLYRQPAGKSNPVG